MCGDVHGERSGVGHQEDPGRRDEQLQGEEADLGAVHEPPVGRGQRGSHGGSGVVVRHTSRSTPSARMSEPRAVTSGRERPPSTGHRT